MSRKHPTLFDKFVRPMFVYRTEKYIKVDVFIVGVFYRLMQVLAVMLVFAQLYYNDGWAMTETPGGMSNAWDEPGSFFATTDDPQLASRTAYCSNASYSFANRNYEMEAPACESLMAAELTSKTMSSLFFTTAIIETETRGWPCFGPEEAALEQGSAAFDDLFGVGGGAAGDASSNASAAAIARAETEACAERTGELHVRRNGQCVCVGSRAVFPLAVDEMLMAFEHAYATSADFDWKGSSADPAASDPGGGLISRLHFPNGTIRTFQAGELLVLPLAEWLTAANVSLDEVNPSVAPDALGRRPARRSTGVLVRVDIEYTNIDLATQRAVPGKRQIHAEVRLRVELATWTAVDVETTWVVHPSLPRDEAQAFHLVEQARHGVLFQFHTSGKVYKFDVFFLLQVLVSAAVMLKLANVLTDAVAFYCLPGGQSTVLRNKRQEIVSKKSEFAEIGMKAALAARFYRSFDPDNNGSIEPVDIVRAFAQVVRSDGEPWVSWEQAHAIAHMILDDADTDDGKLGGQYGLSYEEFMTCMEGDAINFASYLSNLSPPKGATDADECRKAFEEERATLPPVTRPGARDPGAVPRLPAKKLELSDEEKQARLGRKGSLELHLHSASGLKPSDDGWTADPYVVSTLGKREVKSAFIEKCLDPVWGECLKFERMPLEKALSKRKLRLKLMDYDEGFMETDDLLGKLSVDIGSLADHESLAFEEAVKPQGTIVFQLRWVDSGATQKV